MEKTIYLDNCATTRATPAVVCAVRRALREDYENPSSRHAGGVRASGVLGAARQKIADMLKVSPSEIYFTSGGTEGANLAVLGSAQRAGAISAVTTGAEHAAVLNAFKALESRGASVEYLSPREGGAASLADLEEAMRPDTAMVSLIHVNNETGAKTPIEKAGAIVKRRAPGAVFIVDAVQSFGKFELLPKKWGIDILFASAHKIHGPKGVGFIYLSKKNLIRPMFYGGAQEAGLRPGTENLPGIAGFKAACDEADFGAAKRVSKLCAMLSHGISENIADVEINSPEGGSPYILNVSFIGIPGEVMLNALSDEGIYVSTSSACAGGRVSHVLSAMGKRHAKSAVRFGLSAHTTKEEIEKTLEAVIRHYEKLKPPARRAGR